MCWRPWRNSSSSSWPVSTSPQSQVNVRAIVVPPDGMPSILRPRGTWIRRSARLRLAGGRPVLAGGGQEAAAGHGRDGARAPPVVLQPGAQAADLLVDHVAPGHMVRSPEAGQ